MALSEAEIERYARQIVMPEIGMDGQQRLLASRVLVPGAGPGPAAARRYLEAAGVTTTGATQESAAVDCVVLAGPTGESPARGPKLEGLARVWYYTEGTKLVTGLVAPNQPLPAWPEPAAAPGRPTGAAATLAVETAAGTEAAARTVAFLLGWELATATGETELG